MIKVGHKIKKIRELKNLTQEHMADVLKMSQTGYGKIERDESDISLSRLEQISTVFEMKPEDLISFDEKNIFNNYGEIKENQHVWVSKIENHFPEKLQQLYEDKIKLLEEKVAWLEKK
jgi:transcriptional regulator with XRE-family HTH domain